MYNRGKVRRNRPEDIAVRYFAGSAAGRRIVKRPFIRLSMTCG